MAKNNIKMKKIILLLLLSFLSCAKKDRINHYLPKPITPKELMDNGFYRYSEIDTVNKKELFEYSDYINAYTHTHLDSILGGHGLRDSIKFIIRFDMYSNVRPEKNGKGEIRPTQLSNFYGKDTIKRKENREYLKHELKGMVITYLFINDSLEYKSIIVEDFDKKNKEITDFTTQKKIIKYYDSLKIPIKPLLIKDISTKDHPTVFLIGNLKTRIRYNDKKHPFYESSTNYMQNANYTVHNIIGSYYSGIKWYPVN